MCAPRRLVDTVRTAGFNGKPDGNHEDQGASARDKVRVELEEATGGFNQSSVPKPNAKTSDIAISSCSRHCASHSLGQKQTSSREFSTSAVPSTADIYQEDGKVSFVPILLQKSFRGGKRKFLEPLMRFSRGDVRDDIVSSKIDHRPP